jgi:hypothetical protein
MLKFANAALESVILVNPLQLTSVACLFDVKFIFYEFKLLNMNFFIAFVWQYTKYNIVFAMHSILYIVNCTLYAICYIIYIIYYILNSNTMN